MVPSMVPPLCVADHVACIRFDTRWEETFHRRESGGCVFVVSQRSRASEDGLSHINLCRASLHCQKPSALSTLMRKPWGSHKNLCGASLDSQRPPAFST